MQQAGIIDPRALQQARQNPRVQMAEGLASSGIAGALKELIDDRVTMEAMELVAAADRDEAAKEAAKMTDKPSIKDSNTQGINQLVQTLAPGMQLRNNQIQKAQMQKMLGLGGQPAPNMRMADGGIVGFEESGKMQPIPMLMQKYGSEKVMEFLNEQKRFRDIEGNVSPQAREQFEMMKANIESRFDPEMIRAIRQAQSGPDEMADGGIVALKEGGFPDLSGDGKVTQKDVLMGRGVVDKAQGGIVGFNPGGFIERAGQSIMDYFDSGYQDPNAPSSFEQFLLDQRIDPNNVSAEQLGVLMEVFKGAGGVLGFGDTEKPISDEERALEDREIDFLNKVSGESDRMLNPENARMYPPKVGIADALEDFGEGFGIEDFKISDEQRRAAFPRFTQYDEDDPFARRFGAALRDALGLPGKAVGAVGDVIEPVATDFYAGFTEEGPSSEADVESIIAEGGTPTETGTEETPTGEVNLRPSQEQGFTSEIPADIEAGLAAFDSDVSTGTGTGTETGTETGTGTESAVNALGALELSGEGSGAGLRDEVKRIIDREEDPVRIALDFGRAFGKGNTPFEGLQLGGDVLDAAENKLDTQILGLERLIQAADITDAQMRIAQEELKVKREQIDAIRSGNLYDLLASIQNVTVQQARYDTANRLAIEELLQDKYGDQFSLTDMNIQQAIIDQGIDPKDPGFGALVRKTRRDLENMDRERLNRLIQLQ